MYIFGEVLLAIVIYALYIVFSRYYGLVNPFVDWIVLILCALTPLVFYKKRKLSPMRIVAVFAVNAVILFFGSFWLIAFLFGEGL